MQSYSTLKVLIIDNFPEFRMSLKGILQQLGATDIDIASDGKSAIAMCRDKAYDIILSDYDLGDGQDGQQVLEELVWRDLLKPTTVFIIITAENTTEMVMAAIEHTPDSYLTKPFSRDELKNRLDKILHKKVSLKQINRAVITRNYPKALKLSEAMIASNSKYSMACFRIQADLYMKMADLANAEKVFQRVLQQKPLVWANIGMGKLLFAKEDYQLAIKYFNEVLTLFPNYPEALDWIARIHQVTGENELAQKTLQQAVAVSPKSSARQIILGDIARENGDYDIAKRAYRAAIKTSEESVHHNPDSYLKMVNVLTEELTSGGGIKNKRLSSEALSWLKKLESNFKQDAEVKLRATISRHAIYHKLGRTEEQAKHMTMAKMLFNELRDSASGKTSTDMAGAYLREEDFESCQSLLVKVLEEHGDDSDIMAAIEDMIEDKSKFNQALEASKLNAQGIKAHAKNDYDLAIQNFKKALQLAPKNASFTMNLAQVLLKQCDNSDADKRQLIMEIEELLKNLAHVRPKDYRYVRAQQLNRIANDIKIGLSE